MEPLSQQNRIELLQKHPLFSNLEAKELLALADIAHEYDAAEGEIIIHEGDLVDSFYIIVQGEVEVYQTKTVDENPQKIIIALFHATEVLGLDAKGFFSKTGLRTASAKAVQNTQMLKITIDAFQKFLELFPDSLKEMQISNNKFLRLQFIKQLVPFAELKSESVIWLENQMSEIKLPANTILIKEGEIGDSCYCIRKGKIKIISDYQLETEHLLAELKAPDIVGESGMYTGAPRSETAITTEECILLVLKKEQFEHLHTIEYPTFNAFISIIIERSRPERIDENVSLQTRETKEGNYVYVLRDDKLHRYFQLTEPALFIWQQCNGLRTIQEISLNFREEYHEFSAAAISSVVFDLASAGFVKVKGLNFSATAVHQRQPTWINVLLFIKSILEAKYAFKNSDGFLTKLYGYTKFFFSKSMLLFMTTLIVLGFGAFFANIPHALHALHTINPVHLIPMFIALQILSLPLVFIHELSHALTTKHFKRSVWGMGFGWYWLGPMAFTDTSDMWLSPPRKRIKVNIAGIYMDCFFGACFALVAYFSPNILISFFCWLVALSRYVGALANLNPLIELDGYYVLADYLNEPNLREKAVMWLARSRLIDLFNRQYYLSNLNIITFWLLCIVHFCIYLAIILLVQKYVLSIIFPALGASHWTWIFSSILIALAFLTLYAEIKKAKLSV